MGLFRAVGGIAREQREKDIQRVIDRFAEVLERPPYAGNVQLVPLDYENDVIKARREGMEGTNFGKAPEGEPEESFICQVPKKSVGLRLAHDLYRSFLAEFDLPMPEELMERRNDRFWQRRAEWDTRMIGLLRDIVNDDKLIRQLPRGSLDGFLDAEAAGTTEATPAPKPPLGDIRKDRY